MSNQNQWTKLLISSLNGVERAEANLSENGHTRVVIDALEMIRDVGLRVDRNSISDFAATLTRLGFEEIP